MELKKQQQMLSQLYEAQEEIQKEINQGGFSSPKKQELIKLLINKLENNIIDGVTKGI